ncbi:DUF3798 domain-containing protein [Thermovenabulum gondwanense]|uniref:DUF3798 domain-containing protein n=1 Tax=Thermovenabulum gondwanense TaxID=520767 RepID=A0A161Q211_9FIRM|nr:DUF3798 domain-containing protein [Thermovenabulum gondwanense]KYO64358.1 hypothetical protein ATZ99_21180 [Thermovenabulum gondwanense]
MFRKIIALLLIAVTCLGLVACGSTGKQSSSNTNNQQQQQQQKPSYKIAMYTNTVSQNEEEFRSAEQAQKKYPDIIVTQTMPDNFMKEQETLIANAVALVSDPNVKALIMNQAVPGAAAAFEKIKQQRPDVLLIAITPAEQDIIGTKADVVIQADELAMGYKMVEQAKKFGAKVFVHYSFPRHMSYPLLARRRDILKEECAKAGIKFVDATAPDPTGDAGLPGAQQFIIEDIPRKVKEYGKDTVFFSTNCGMQEPLIKTALEQGAMVVQQCCPSPFHGYPTALGINIPPDKAGDVDYVIQQIKAKIAEKGGTGRFSTWPIPAGMLMAAAAVEYAKLYAEGKLKDKNDPEALKKCFEEVSKGAKIDIGNYVEKGADGKEIKHENFYMILSDYITF